MQPVQQSTERVVVGTLAGVEPRSNGWFRFSIQEQGKQWPVKADTKKPEVVNACTSLLGQVVTAKINEQVSTNINPNNGQPYTNRYLNSVAPGAQQGDFGQQSFGQQPAGQPVQQQQYQGPQQPAQRTSDQTRELRIMRIAASKNACEMLSLLPLEQQGMRGLVELSEAWVAYFVYGAARFGVQAFNAAPQQPPVPQQPVQQGAQLGPEEPGGGSEYNPGYASQGAQQAPPQPPPPADPQQDQWGDDDDIPF